MAFAIVRHFKGSPWREHQILSIHINHCLHANVRMQVCMGRGVLSEDLIKVDGAVNTLKI